MFLVENLKFFNYIYAIYCDDVSEIQSIMEMFVYSIHKRKLVKTRRKFFICWNLLFHPLATFLKRAHRNFNKFCTRTFFIATFPHIVKFIAFVFEINSHKIFSRHFSECGLSGKPINTVLYRHCHNIVCSHGNKLIYYTGKAIDLYTFASSA